MELATSSVAIEDVPVMIGTDWVDDDDDAHDVKDDNDDDDDDEEEEEEEVDQDVQNALYEVWQGWLEAREAWLWQVNSLLVNTTSLTSCWACPPISCWSLQHHSKFHGRLKMQTWGKVSVTILANTTSLTMLT